jgi:hypothetical protein
MRPGAGMAPGRFASVRISRRGTEAGIDGMADVGAAARLEPRRLKSRQGRRDVGLRRRLLPRAVRVHTSGVPRGPGAKFEQLKLKPCSQSASARDRAYRSPSGGFSRSRTDAGTLGPGRMPAPLHPDRCRHPWTRTDAGTLAPGRMPAPLHPDGCRHPWTGRMPAHAGGCRFIRFRYTCRSLSGPAKRYLARPRCSSRSRTVLMDVALIG